MPRYTDDDTFLLAGGDELVPALNLAADGGWEPDSTTASVDGTPCVIRRFRPRIEESFARIEQCAPTAGGAPFWRMTSRDNVTSTFGRTSDGRIADTGRPEPGQRVAEWLLQEVRDDRGNITVYEYKSEDLAGVDPGSVYERNRLDVTPTGRYLKRVRYGNLTPDSAAKTCFLVVFDYGEHDDTPACYPTTAQPTSPPWRPLASRQATKEGSYRSENHSEVS